MPTRQTLQAPAWLALLFASIAICAGASVDVSAYALPAAQRAFGAIQPAISPDGRTVALSFQGAICRLPIEGGVLAELTREEGWDVEPAWTPDGRCIAYVNAPGFHVGSLRMIRADTGEPVALPAVVAARRQLQFDPTGRRLLGLLAQSGQPDRLQWYDLESGALAPVPISGLEAHQRSNFEWALSPDGATIILATFQDRPGEQGGNNGPATDLWLMSSDGGAVRRLARWPARIHRVCWDPDGSAVVVVTDRGGARNDLWRVPLANPVAEATRLTSGQADEAWPSLPVDGAVLLHTDNREGATAVVALNRTTGERRDLVVDRIDYRTPTGALELRLQDSVTHESITARVSIRRVNGKFHFPLGAAYYFTGGQGHFYLRGEARLPVPAGRYLMQVWHGPEYRFHRSEIEVLAGERRKVTVPLQRWINLPAGGWFSGENHIHANYGYGAWHNDVRSVRDQCEGEDLQVANVLAANADGDGVFDRDLFLGAPDPLSTPRLILYWNQEFRSTIWGHLTLNNLSQLVEPLFTGFKDTTNPWDVPPTAEIARRARAQRGSVSYTHPAEKPDQLYDGAYAAKGLPVDAALGLIDTLDVMGWGYEAACALWYRILNCGFRIPASAGTDVFLNRIPSAPPGWGRCYVKINGPLTYEGWIEGQKAGRSFVTTGPVLEWNVEGREVGEVIRLDRPRRVRVQARARSQVALTELQLVLNGSVVRTRPATAPAHELLIDDTVEIATSGWIAVRCVGGNASGFGEPSRGAHSNPIYFEVPGRPFDARADARFFLDWIDRLEADLHQRDRVPAPWGGDVAFLLKHARAEYRKLQ
jgi:hypothetical protein